MSDKDSNDLQKEDHNGSARKTSVTEINMNQNLAAK
jgi:hypothetical protein